VNANSRYLRHRVLWQFELRGFNAKIQPVNVLHDHEYQAIDNKMMIT
jgi:hypothetical protein